MQEKFEDTKVIIRNQLVKGQAIKVVPYTTGKI